MCPQSEIVVVVDDIAGHRHGAVEDVGDGDHCGDTTTDNSEEDQKVTVDSLPEWQTPETENRSDTHSARDTLVSSLCFDCWRPSASCRREEEI